MVGEIGMILTVVTGNFGQFPYNGQMPETGLTGESVTSSEQKKT
jgi:hypothetical protein